MKTEIEGHADLVCEAILDEMARADRWIAVEKAWRALLNVRRMSNSMADEERYFAGVGRQSAPVDMAAAKEPPMPKAEYPSEAAHGGSDAG